MGGWRGGEEVGTRGGGGCGVGEKKEGREGEAGWEEARLRADMTLQVSQGASDIGLAWIYKDKYQ